MINEISSLLNDSTRLLDGIAKSLDWDKEVLASQEHVKSCQCPVNEGHVMESCYLDKHVGKCRLRNLGVDLKNDVCPSSCFFYKSSSSVVSVASNASGLEPDIPAEVLRFRQTPEERLRSYDHVVEIAKSKRKLQGEQSEGDVNMADDAPKGVGEQFKSKLEMLAEQRDYKRRRQSYRAKNVHITKRTPTDIMREIIDNRMQELRNMQEENITFEQKGRD